MHKENKKLKQKKKKVITIKKIAAARKIRNILVFKKISIKD